MTISSKTAPKNDVPALNINLSGKALIEASAGTGKTWTLTAILLRLLLQEGRAARQIIATTFTRKAAAEMQRRLYEALLDFQKKYQELNQLSDAEKKLVISALEEPIQKYIFQSEFSQWGKLGANCYLALSEFNQIFIGTLDSLCRRWLSEYSLESGATEKRQLMSNDETLSLKFNHQHLRKKFQEKSSDLDFLANFLSNDFDTLENLEQISMKALEYPEALLTCSEVKPLPYSLLEMQTKFAEISATPFLEFLNELLLQEALNKNNRVVKKPNLLLNLWQKLKTLQNLNSDEIEYLQAVLKIKVVKKFAHLEQELKEHEFLKSLEEALEYWQIYKKNLQQLSYDFYKSGIENAQQNFSQELNQAKLTTFSEEWKILNKALENIDLCRYIRHRYPIILVDESQDLNASQASLLEKIYLQIPPIEQQFIFVLLVGDPKQAIYRFRGGDVHNYLRLKRFFNSEEIYALLLNRRSSPNLINALNHHYQSKPFLGEGIEYQQIEALLGERKLQQLQIDGQSGAIQQPLIWLESENNKYQQVVQLIEALCAENCQYHQNGKAISYQDIMILARTNEQLIKIAEVLQQAGINYDLQSSNSIFTTDLARDFTLLLQALLQPQNTEIVNALLCSSFFNFSLQNLPEIIAERNQLQMILQESQDNIQKKGLLSALLNCCWKSGIWHNLANLENVKNNYQIIFFRKILSIVARFAPRMQFHLFYQWWLQQLENPSQADWALIPTLVQNQAISLLSVHKAKGLQAPVVIIFGFGNSKSNNKNNNLHHYYRDEQSYLHIGEISDDLAQEINKEDLAEEARLLYVALTRAEDLSIIFKNDKNQAQQELLKNSLCAESALWQSIDISQNILKLSFSEQIKQTNQNYQIAKNKRFFPSLRTSFSALLQNSLPVDIPDFSTEDIDIFPQSVNIHSNYRFQFPRGTQAGTFLHSLLERLNPKFPQYWQDEMRRIANRQQFIIEDEKSLFSWLEEIYAIPLKASNLTLQEIDNRSPELDFMLSINAPKLAIKQINQLFNDYGKAINLREDERNYRFLRGEIDLVYQQQNKYYIVDYKSNFLGDNWQNYLGSALEEAMLSHQYYLQAAIYQLALYRRLRLLKNFDFSQLGGVEYLFLRGMHPEINSSGCYFWDIPTQFLLELDNLLN